MGKNKNYSRCENWNVRMSVKEERMIGLQTKRCLVLFKQGACARSCEMMGLKRSVRSYHAGLIILNLFQK